MRKIILAITLSLSLAGCATFKNIETAIQLGTASIANPVTKTRLNQMESAVTLVFAGLNAWKKSCQQGLIPPECRQHIAAVQVYTRQVPPYLAQLRQFVRNDDQVNATVVFNNLINDFRNNRPRSLERAHASVLLAVGHAFGNIVEREAKDKLCGELADTLITSVHEVWLQEFKRATADAEVDAIDARWAPEVDRAVKVRLAKLGSAVVALGAAHQAFKAAHI